MSAACSNAPLVAFASKRTPRHVQRCGDRCDDDRAPNGTVKSAPELTPEQIRAADRIDEFLGAERDFPLVVHGLAGTGKTTLLADVALRLTAVLVAPTGKAASVLRKKTGMSVSTIHGLLYVPHEIRDVDGFVVGVTWSKKRPELLRESLHRRTVLVDEGSMVTDNIKDDLLNTGAQVVVFGDPGQLPPNGGRNTFFAQPHVRLREIHRQAEGSPIIRQAYAVRIGGYYCTDGTAFSATHEATDDDLDWADVVLCWKNATRRQLNAIARQRRGYGPLQLPVRGEPLVCLRNDHERGVMNGEVVTVERDLACVENLKFHGRPSEIDDWYIEGISHPVAPEPRPGHYAFGYALTVHKAQGSEWPRVLILDECCNQDRPRWLYTAITRASSEVRIAQSLGTLQYSVSQELVA